MAGGELSFVMKIWGDISNLTKSLSKGKDEVKSFGKGTDASFKDLVKSVRIAEDQFKRFAVQMGVNSKEAKGALNDYKKLRGELDQINNSLRPKSGVNIGSQIAGVVGKFAAIGTVAAGVTSFFKGAIEGAMEDERANRRLLASLDGNEAAFSRMEQWKNKMFNTTLFSEAEIMSAITMGTEMGKTEAQTQKMVETAMGLSRATGQDLNTAMLQLNQALEGNIGRLGKFIPDWVNMTEEQRKSVDVLGVLNDRFGRLASEGLTTTEGQLIQVKKNWEEFSDSIGSVILPAVGKLLGAMNKLLSGGSSGGGKSYMQDYGDKQMSAMSGAGSSDKRDSIIKKNEELAQSYYKLWKAATDPDKKAQYSRNYDEQLEVVEKLKAANAELGTTHVKTAAKAVASSNEMLNSTIAYQKALFAGTLVGPRGDQTIGQMTNFQSMGKMQSKTGLTAGGGVTMPAPGSMNYAQGGGGFAPDMSDWSAAIDEVAQKAQGLGSTFQNVFTSISTLVGKVATGFSDGWKGAMESVGAVLQAGISAITGLFTQQSEQRLTELDEYYNAERDNIQNSKKSDKEKAKALEKLEAETSAKRKSLMRDQAKQQKTASLMQAIVAGALAVVQAFAAGPGIGLVLGLIMAGLVAAQIAVIASQPLPALAQGGLATAPTLALVGDNPNARIDPEVIAPLSRLQGMFQSEQGGDRSLSVRLNGDDLLFVLERAQRSKLRRY